MSALTIKCKLHRAGGTKVTIGSSEYHFKDDGFGNHVAIVSDMKHAQTFMGIPEGYELFSAVGIADTETAIGIGEAVVNAPVATAPAPAPVEVDTTSAETGTSKAASAEPLKTTLNAQVGLSPDMNIDELRAIFLTELGRNPSPKAGAETMIAQIQTIREERAGQ